MFVPVTPVQSVTPLTPVGIVSTKPPLGVPRRTKFFVRNADLNVLDGHSASIAGVLLPGLRRRVVTLQALGNHGWATVARAQTATKGRFRLTYTRHQTGTELVRLRFAGDVYGLGSHQRVGQLSVYRLAGASWYGGGGGLACGGSLTSSTMGVANKTLPCGTLVTLRYNGRSVRVPVVDRGPFVAGREFDLTQATKQALGFGDIGQVWTTR